MRGGRGGQAAAAAWLAWWADGADVLALLERLEGTRTPAGGAAPVGGDLVSVEADADGVRADEGALFVNVLGGLLRGLQGGALRVRRDVHGRPLRIVCQSGCLGRLRKPFGNVPPLLLRARHVYLAALRGGGRAARDLLRLRLHRLPLCFVGLLDDLGIMLGQFAVLLRLVIRGDGIGGPAVHRLVVSVRLLVHVVMDGHLLRLVVGWLRGSLGQLRLVRPAALAYLLGVRLAAIGGALVFTPVIGRLGATRHVRALWADELLRCFGLLGRTPGRCALCTIRTHALELAPGRLDLVVARLEARLAIDVVAEVPRHVVAVLRLIRGARVHAPRRRLGADRTLRSRRSEL